MIYIEELLFSPAIICIYVCVFCFVYPYYDILNDKTKRRSIFGYIVYQLSVDCKSAIVNLLLNHTVFLRRLRIKTAEFSFLCRRGLWVYKNAFFCLHGFKASCHCLLNFYLFHADYILLSSFISAQYFPCFYRKLFRRRISFG